MNANLVKLKLVQPVKPQQPKQNYKSKQSKKNLMKEKDTNYLRVKRTNW
jgi:hypothetical protein